MVSNKVTYAFMNTVVVLLVAIVRKLYNKDYISEEQRYNKVMRHVDMFLDVLCDETKIEAEKQ